MSTSRGMEAPPTPRLSVQTQAQAGPSSSTSASGSGSGTGAGGGSIGRRPLGARRRGVAAGLYVANPDNSDDDGSGSVYGPGQSPIKTSAASASGSGSGSGSSPIIPSGGNRLHHEQSYQGQNHEHRGLPTIPGSSSTPSLSLSHPQTPPLPPPQPDRHLQQHTQARRAYTTPIPPESNSQRPHDTRHFSLSGQGGQGQSSQSQAQAQSSIPTSPARSGRHALPSPPIHPPTSPPIQSHDLRPLPPNPNIRMSSPEEAMSPMTEGRARSGSFNASAKKLLQVTTDNEQFTLVDITGMNTADAIRDRIFSKVSLIIQSQE
jgi:mitogen-activated protein kinase kinase kinase